MSGYLVRRVEREPESPGMALRALREMNHKTLGDLARFLGCLDNLFRALRAFDDHDRESREVAS